MTHLVLLTLTVLASLVGSTTAAASVGDCDEEVVAWIDSVRPYFADRDFEYAPGVVAFYLFSDTQLTPALGHTYGSIGEHDTLDLIERIRACDDDIIPRSLKSNLILALSTEQGIANTLAAVDQIRSSRRRALALLEMVREGDITLSDDMTRFVRAFTRAGRGSDPVVLLPDSAGLREARVAYLDVIRAEQKRAAFLRYVEAAVNRLETVDLSSDEIQYYNAYIDFDQIDSSIGTSSSLDWFTDDLRATYDRIVCSNFEAIRASWTRPVLQDDWDGETADPEGLFPFLRPEASCAPRLRA
ncbi:MAG: hypothetical protein AAFN13_14495, partial [Bacteroidota bacterium]